MNAQNTQAKDQAERDFGPQFCLQTPDHGDREDRKNEIREKVEHCTRMSMLFKATRTTLGLPELKRPTLRKVVSDMQTAFLSQVSLSTTD